MEQKEDRLEVLVFNFLQLALHRGNSMNYVCDKHDFLGHKNFKPVSQIRQCREKERRSDNPPHI